MLGECHLILSLPGKALRMLVDLPIHSFVYFEWPLKTGFTV